MAGRSSDFLNINESERIPGRHRSRSGGYADLIEQQTRWDRRDRERQMKRYHDSHLSPTSAASADRHYAPAFDTSHRRSRSHEDIVLKQQQEDAATATTAAATTTAATYKVREAVPAITYGPTRQAIRANENPMPRGRNPRQKKPSIRVEIHQHDPPGSVSSPKSLSKSPNASPRSPSTTAHLQLQCVTLQGKIAQVGNACSPYAHVEAANARDLTFAKIFEQLKGIAFELDVWSHVSRLDDMIRIESGKRRIVEAASRTLGRMTEKISALEKACGEAKPRDLKVELLPEVDSDDGFGEDGSDVDDSGTEKAVTESPAFIIQSHLNSIHMQMQTLKRLSRSLQEATPSAKDEVIATSDLVAEVGKYFSSQEMLDRYRIDTRVAGGKALDEARYAARGGY